MSKRNPLAGFTFQDPVYLAVKAMFATCIAYVTVGWLGNQDVITATFVAVLCCSPAVSIGMRQGVSQLVGSMLGGMFGVVILEMGAPLWLGVPIAVALSIRVAFAVGFKEGANVAAFTAIFVQVVPFGSVETNWLMRQEAVVVAGLSAAVVNIVVSGIFYPRVFRKRLAKVDALIDQLLLSAESDPLRVNPAFRILGALDTELKFASRELKLRGAHEQRADIVAMHRWVEHQTRKLHYVYSLGLLIREQSLDPVEVAPIIAWARQPQQDPPPIPQHMRVLATRLVDEVSARPVRPT